VDTRLIALRAWLAEVVKRDVVDIAPASADASFRRYFRVRFAADTAIVMDAPPEKENSQPFVTIAGMLQTMGLNVPRVLAHNFQHGFFLLSDLGSTPYLSVLNPNNVAQLYGDAMAALLTLQREGKPYQAQLPAYDEKLLWNEMQLFRDWYLARHLQLTLAPPQHAILDRSWHYLVQQALAQPPVFVHRDYHSRNLMYSDGSVGRNPGILDFQDAVHGPITYDLVSLLRDCYITWPRAQIEAWVNDYHAQLHDAGMIKAVSAAQFLQWFDLMGIQRHLKASGIFARLNYRDGKPGYLADIPRTLNYVLDVAQGYPELHALSALFNELDIARRLSPTTNPVIN
jgi:hypothetical protein